MLKELIDQFYLEQQKNKEQTRFYITDVGKCHRAVFFKFKNAPREKADPRILRIYERGEHLHRNIFNILYRLRIGLTTEVSIPAQEIISGRADAIICLNNRNYVLDIKSINSMIFKKMTQPKEENVYQLQLYLHYFKIKEGILLYIDKDQQDIKEFLVSYDENLVRSLLKDFESLRDKINKNIVPQRLPDYPQNWQCQYCQFRTVCQMAEGKEMKWEDFKKKIETADNNTLF
jgi:CRISPR/Cas system-associated exonuclease Cas4 (RecB family)